MSYVPLKFYQWCDILYLCYKFCIFSTSLFTQHKQPLCCFQGDKKDMVMYGHVHYNNCTMGIVIWQFPFYTIRKFRHLAQWVVHIISTQKHMHHYLKQTYLYITPTLTILTNMAATSIMAATSNMTATSCPVVIKYSISQPSNQIKVL
jgi:hypothetical protein